MMGLVVGMSRRDICSSDGLRADDNDIAFELCKQFRIYFGHIWAFGHT
eukprot:COSAG02_NODE_1178_length_14042_cov_11.526674_5_plen_48_part_00